MKRLFVLVIASFALLGCPAKDAPRTPEETCAAACATKAPRCSEGECARGCSFSLDRIIEREDGVVLACVAKQPACDDAAWAKCGARVGPHVDGGPPGPPPPPPEE